MNSDLPHGAGAQAAAGVPSPAATRPGSRPRVVVALVALVLASCTYLGAPSSPPPAPPVAHLVSVDEAECRALLHDDAPAASLHEAVARSVDYLQKLPSDRTLIALDRGVTAAELLSVLHATADAARREDGLQGLCDEVHVYRAELPTRILFTGYYQPALPASRTPTTRFRYPLYRTPSDLVEIDLGAFCAACSGRVAQGRLQSGKLVPYYSRAEIDAGILAGRNDELAWLDDPVEAFFLHIQGSALLRFDDGVHMEVSYSNANGHPYTSFARVLIDQGKMSRDAVSLQALKDYLRARPDEQAALMAANQRYIFFRTVPTGPIGSLGVPLTAGRSIAADASAYPRGALVYLRIAPRQGSTQETVARFATIQDTGAAITGAQRIDVFWGTGATAEAIAGEMRNPGELYVLLPRGR